MSWPTKFILRLTTLPVLFVLFYPPLAWAVDKPDLTVTDIKVNNKCQFVVTVRNIGKAPLPSSAYLSTGVYLQLKYFSTGGMWALSGVDPGKALMSPGGVVNFTVLATNFKVTASHALTATIDSKNTLIESNESNNVLSKSPSCTAPLPDLIVSRIDFISDCRPMISIRNVGNAAVPGSAYGASGASLSFYLDGAYKGNKNLGTVDPQKRSQAAGSVHAWTDAKHVVASKSLAIKLNHVSGELNTKNNYKKVDVPKRCRGLTEIGGPRPDLTVTKLKTNVDCQLVVGVKNLGPGMLPDSAYTNGNSPVLKLYQENKHLSSWAINGIDSMKALKNPGGYMEWTLPAKTFTGPVRIRTILNKNKIVSESNYSNNNISGVVSCNANLPDLTITKVGFTADCRATVNIRNMGNGPVPNKAYMPGGIYISRFIDGVHSRQDLYKIDPGKKTRAAGAGYNWVDYPLFKAKRTAKYMLRNLGREKNSGNNVYQANVPQRCKHKKDMIKIAPKYQIRNKQNNARHLQVR